MEIAKCKRRPLVRGVAACVINSGVEDISAPSLCLQVKGMRESHAWIPGIITLSQETQCGAKQALSRAFKEVDGKGNRVRNVLV